MRPSILIQFLLNTFHIHCKSMQVQLFDSKQFTYCVAQFWNFKTITSCAANWMSGIENSFELTRLEVFNFEEIKYYYIFTVYEIFVLQKSRHEKKIYNSNYSQHTNVTKYLRWCRNKKSNQNYIKSGKNCLQTKIESYWHYLDVFNALHILPMKGST